MPSVSLPSITGEMNTPVSQTIAGNPGNYKVPSPPMASSPKILVFKAQVLRPPEKPVAIQLIKWRPSPRSIRPPGKPFKYAFYSLFHYLGVFGSAAFQQVTAQVEGRSVGSLLIVPAHFKYPFMARNDVQLTYVLVDPSCRGQGIAWEMMFDATRDVQADIWYVTDESNCPSIALARKAGFELAGVARRSGRVTKILEIQ